MSDIQDFDNLLKLTEWALTKDYTAVAEGKGINMISWWIFGDEKIFLSLEFMYLYFL